MDYSRRYIYDYSVLYLYVYEWTVLQDYIIYELKYRFIRYSIYIHDAKLLG